VQNSRLRNIVAFIATVLATILGIIAVTGAAVFLYG
jgi:hypothetical protein